MTGPLSLISAVVTVIGVLVLAYWCTRLLGKRWVTASSCRNMKVVEQLPLGQDKKLLLLKLNGRHYLVGVSQAGIQLLTEIEGEFEEIAVPEQEVLPSSFKEQIRHYADLYRNQKGGDR